MWCLHALNCFHSPLKEKRWACPSTCCSPSPSSCCCSPIRSPKRRWGCPSSSTTSCSPWSWWRSRSSSAWSSWTSTTARPTHTRCPCGFARWGRHWFQLYSTRPSVVCLFLYFMYLYHSLQHYSALCVAPKLASFHLYHPNFTFLYSYLCAYQSKTKTKTTITVVYYCLRWY